MYVLFLVALLVAGFVAEAHGILAGLAAFVGSFVALVALILLLGRWIDRGQGKQAGDGSTATDSVQTAAAPMEMPDDDAVAPRDSDRPLPRDLLPYPIGGGGSVPPGLVGRECYLLPLRIDMGGAPACWSWRAATWIRGDEAHKLFAAQLYERLQRALADPAAEDGDAVPLISEDDLARHRFTLEGVRLIAVRSRDARWGGFVHGAESFRFPLERLVGLQLGIGRPARGSGGYELQLMLAEGDERKPSLETHLAYNERTTSSLLVATMQLGKLWDVRVGADEYADEWRGSDDGRPYDR